MSESKSLFPYGALTVTLHPSWLSLVFLLVIPYCVAGMWWGGENIGDGPHYSGIQNLAGWTMLFSILAAAGCIAGIVATLGGWL